MELLHQHMNTNDLKNWIILNQTPSIRPKRFLKILNSQLTLKSIIQSPRLTQFHFKLPSKAIEYLENHDDCYYDQPVDWLSRSSNHHIVTDDSQIYPECLRNIPQPPMILYGIGNIDLLDTRQISIVGTRNFSPYGKSNAQYFSKALSNLGYTITSELASGINVIYPHQNMRVARSFIEDFGSCQNRITTLADGFAPDAHLRTDLPKNKPTVSFLKASTAYMALRAGKYLPASKGRSATHNLSMEPKGSPSEDYSTSASPLLSRSEINGKLEIVKRT